MPILVSASRRAVRGRWLPVVLGLLLLQAVPAASAPLGSVTWQGCASDDGSSAVCTDVPGSPLTGAKSVAVSPNGKSVYVASSAANSISWFSASSTGALTWKGCWSDDGSGGTCTDLEGAPITGASSVAVSPDGKSVYVAAITANSVTRFDRASNGALAFAWCFSDDGSAGECGDLAGSPLTGADAVAVTPDGTSVYVAAYTAASVAHFSRDSVGAITWQGCVSDDGSGGVCANAPGTSVLSGAFALAVNPASSVVYVASVGSDSLSAVGATTPQPAWLTCVSDDGSNAACADLSQFGAPLDGARGVAVSPDGASVIVAARLANTVTHLDVMGPASLQWDGCVSDDGSGGMCTDAPQTPLTGTSGVTVSPDGKSVYATSLTASSVSHLTLAAGHPLGWQGCLSDDGSNGSCGDVPGDPLSSAYFAAVSPDGASVYVAGFAANSVAHLIRHLAPPNTSISSAKVSSGMHRATFKFTSTESPSTFRCKLDGGHFNRCSSPKTYTGLSAGAHVFRVEAVNVQHTVDPTPAKKGFRIPR